MNEPPQPPANAVLLLRSNLVRSNSVILCTCEFDGSSCKFAYYYTHMYTHSNCVYAAYKRKHVRVCASLTRCVNEI